MTMAAVTRLTEAEPKPLGMVRIECDYPVVALALKEILKEEADIYEVHNTPPQMEYLSSVILCPNGRDDVTSEVRRLRDQSPDATVLVFDMHVDPRRALKALRAGARGFLHAGMRPEQIVRVVRQACEGKTLIPEGLLENLMVEESAAVAPRVLTPRQREIVGLAYEGLSNAQIAQRLFLTESTIKGHLRAAYKLLKVRNRTQAAKLLREA